MTYWQLISTGDPVQTGDPVGSDRITTSPARTGTGETGNGPVTCLNCDRAPYKIPHVHDGTDCVHHERHCGLPGLETYS